LNENMIIDPSGATVNWFNALEALLIEHKKANK